MIQFYKFICEHKEEHIREQAVFNLPCIHLLFKKFESDLEIKFDNLYLEFAQSDNYKVRMIIAKSLHEAFKLV